MINKILYFILENKLVTCLSVLLFSFFVATIALAVERNDFADRLNTCNAEMDKLTTTTTSTESTTTVGPTSGGFRLDPNIFPILYEILLIPDLESETFNGTVDITFSVTKESRIINVHSYLLEWTKVTLKLGDKPIETTYDYNSEHEIYEIQPNSGDVSIGTYDMSIEYHGNLSGEVGFYVSKLDDGSKIASSKFEPTHARQAFPCFDEPGMKASFLVKIVKPSNFIALSNMDQANEEEYGDAANGLSMVTFNESVPMSTYLACFIVCNFTYSERTIPQASGNFTFRVYATSEDQLHKVDFAVDIGERVTKYYIEYFNIDYPLPKLDMIGIPDFVSGAMEHWGLVTFRETALLQDNQTTSTATKQNIARVIAHEVSHMWFGNLVTMAWWDEIWLNEGFASYMQYKALDNLEPTWKTMEQFLSANTIGVMNLDATLSSHPIVVKVETPDEITAIFDSISYNKGAAVLRMLEGFIGNDFFQKGVTDYLNKYKYNNTITQNLLDELVKYFDSEKNLTHIMNTWTRQMGLPLVSITDNPDGSYTLKQQRFLADPEAVDSKTSEYNYQWFIPITYKTDKGVSNKTVWFPDTEESVTLTPDTNEKVIKLNNDQVGYYRVTYTDTMWDAIEQELAKNDSSVLTPSDKANLINDVFTLAEAGHISYTRALSVSSYLSQEVDNYVPWAVASNTFGSLNRIMSNSLAYSEFQAHVRNLLTNIIDKIGWGNAISETEEEHIVKMTRSVVLSLACQFGHEECLNQARDRFVEWLNSNETIDPDIKGVVYYYGVERTDDSQWLEFFKRYQNETDAQEKSRMMQSLAASRSPSRLKWYIQKAWDENVVRSQDYFSVLQYISSNPVGTPIVWDHFREHWDQIVDRFTLNSRTLGTTVPAITRTFATRQKLQEMKDFFASNPEAGAGTTARKQALEYVENNIKWMEKKEPEFRKWLLENVA